MKDKLKSILFEEIDRIVEDINPSKLKNKKFLQEIFSFNYNNFLKDLGSQEIDTDVELGTELWDWFINTVSESIKENPDEWKKMLHEQKMKIISRKYFTRDLGIEQDKLESYLKKNIRKYFTSLQNYSDLEGFRNKVSNLPSDLLTCFVRFLFLLSKDLKEEIKITPEELKKEIQELLKLRFEMIEKLDFVSKKYVSNIDLRKIKKLYDYGLFFEDTILNRAVNEYFQKMLVHADAVNRLKDTYTNTFVADLKAQIESSPSFINYVSRIKNNEDISFFTDKGKQVGNRFSSQIQMIKEKQFDESLIDKSSRIMEPVDINNIIPSPLEMDVDEEGNSDEEKNDSLDSGSSSSSSSGGGFSGGGSSFGGGDDLGGDSESLEGDDTLEGDNDLSNTEGETPLPNDEQGFPVDFGSQESNPEAMDNAENNTSEKSKEVEDKS